MEVLITVVVFAAILIALLWYVDQRGKRNRDEASARHLQRDIGPTQYGVPRGVDPQSMADWSSNGGAP